MRNKFEINTSSQINILGYSGSILAIYFDILEQHGFKGNIKIIKNDNRTDQELFDSGIAFEIIEIKNLNSKNRDEFLLCSNKPATRLFLCDAFKQQFPAISLNLMTLIHPFSYIGSGVIIEQGVVIEPSVCVAPFAHIGTGVFISRSSSVGHHTNIGNWSAINPGVTLTGRIRIGESVTIGPGTTVFNDVVIGNHTIIGGGSVVTRDIPDGVVAYGNPCRVIKEIR